MSPRRTTRISSSGANSMTHKELVEAGARWLKKRHVVIITEMAGQREEPDVLGFLKSLSTTLLECKASREDFLADQKKKDVRCGNFRYYLVPKGLISVEEVPDGWGLLYADGRGVRKILSAKWKAKKDAKSETGLLVSSLRRIGRMSPRGISVRFYTYETKNRATLGVGQESESE